VGIQEAHLPVLFESSFTTRVAEKGTGLGLGIARRLCRQFGGELTCESTAVDVGTTFLVSVPAYEDPDMENSTREPNRDKIIEGGTPKE
jgi:signal transduction histidine kinase